MAFILAILIYPFRHKISAFLKGKRGGFKVLVLFGLVFLLLETRAFGRDIFFESNIKKEKIDMAKKIEAFVAYGPRLKLGRTVNLDELVSYIAGRTGLSDGEISIVIKELRDAVAFFNLSGKPVKLNGLGIYAPKISMDGKFSSWHRADNELKQRLNTPKRFKGEIVNRESIGLTMTDLITLWNKEHPDNPIES